MGKIMLSHGDGGQLTHDLIQHVFQPFLNDPVLHEQNDAAVLPSHPGYVAVSTDSFVIQPIEFPGGDIGKLAVAGTVNDLAVSGAKPAYLTAGFILEEGLEMPLLKRILRSMRETALQAGVRIIAGDTKVVERGKCGGVIINTTGIGFIENPERINCCQICQGDRIVINGGIAEHAVAILAERAGLEFAETLCSDCRPLNFIIEQVMEKFHTIRFMRDPTRGGMATTLKEITESTGYNMVLQEDSIPMRAEVKGALEIMGIDPLYMANEGKVLFIVSEEESSRLVEYLRTIPGNEMAAEIGCVQEGAGRLLLQTATGGTRELGRLTGTPLPRIC